MREVVLYGRAEAGELRVAQLEAGQCNGDRAFVWCKTVAERDDAHFVDNRRRPERLGDWAQVDRMPRGVVGERIGVGVGRERAIAATELQQRVPTEAIRRAGRATVERLPHRQT